MISKEIKIGDLVVCERGDIGIYLGMADVAPVGHNPHAIIWVSSTGEFDEALNYEWNYSRETRATLRKYRNKALKTIKTILSRHGK